MLLSNVFQEKHLLKSLCDIIKARCRHLRPITIERKFFFLTLIYAPLKGVLRLKIGKLSVHLNVIARISSHFDST